MNTKVKERQARSESHTKTEKRAQTDGRSNVTSVERREEYENVGSDGAVREERIVKDSASDRIGLAHKLSQLVWLLGGLLQAILGLRFLLKLIAANPNSPFADFIYQFSDMFLWPFQALTISPSTPQGVVLEIPTLIAMVIYAILTWAVVRLIELILIPSTREKVTVYRREES